MLYLAAKALLSGVIVAAVSEVARRWPGVGGLIASLPLVSILAVIWLWRDTRDIARIADHLEATFWFVLPSLPMFLMMPALLRKGMGFWFCLALMCVFTLVLYGISLLLYARWVARG